MVDRSSPGIDKVLGRDRTAITSLGLAQSKGIGLAVLGNRAAGGQGRHQLAIFPDPVQAFHCVPQLVKADSITGLGHVNCRNFS